MSSPLPPLPSSSGAASPEPKRTSRPQTSQSDWSYGVSQKREHEVGIAVGGLYPGPQSARHAVRPEPRCYVSQTLSKLSQDTMRVRRRIQHGYDAQSREASPATESSPSFPRESWIHPSTGGGDISGGISTELRTGLSLDENGEPDSIAHGLLSVAKVISSWENEVRLTADIWSGHLSAQAKWSAEGDERWTGLNSRMEHLDHQLGVLTKEVREQAEKMEAAQKRESSQLVSAVKVAVGELGSNRAKADEELYKQLVDQKGIQTDSIKRHVTELVSGTLDKSDGQQQSIGQQMGLFNEGLANLKTSVDGWHHLVDDFRQNAEEAKAVAEKTQKQLVDSQAEVTRLGTLTETLKERMNIAEAELEKVTYAPALDVWRKLKDLEANGNVKIDRQTGRVELLKDIQFAQADATAAPAAELRDVTQAHPILSDVAEVLNLFRTPLNVDVQILPGKGGKPDFWQEVAVCQARVIKEQLVRYGVEDSLVAAGGQLAIKGAKSNFTLLQLNQEIFPRQEAAEEAKKGAGKKK